MIGCKRINFTSIPPTKAAVRTKNIPKIMFDCINLSVAKHIYRVKTIMKAAGVFLKQSLNPEVVLP